MRPSVALGAIALVGGVAVWASMTLTPASHDFGKVFLGASTSQQFQLSGTTPLSSRGIPVATVTGRDAADFVIDSTGAGTGGSLPSTCLGTTWAQGSCDYAVVFRPLSTGKKSAELVVKENGETATAPLTGEGVVRARPSTGIDCLPILVPCNYAHWYSGTYTTTEVDSTVTGKLNRKVRMRETVDIRLELGVATCTVVRDDWEEEYTGSRLDKRSTAKGDTSGRGLFAIEFRGLRREMEYTLKFACPSPKITTVSIDYIKGTTDTGMIPAEPADWRHGGLAADPQPATQIGMVSLVGSQRDVRSVPENDEGGYVTMRWSIKLWP